MHTGSSCRYTYLKVTLEMVEGEALDSHYPHDGLWRCLYTYGEERKQSMKGIKMNPSKFLSNT